MLADVAARRMGMQMLAIVAAFLVPPAVAAAAALLLFSTCRGGADSSTAIPATGLALAGLAAGAISGAAAVGRQRRALGRNYEQSLDDLDHDLRGPLTIIRGEVELVLSQEDVPAAERGRSAAAIIGELEALERCLHRRYRP